MSTIKVTNLRHESATSDNISLTSTNRVGIGTASPSVVVEAQAAQAELQLTSTSGTNSAGLRFLPGGQTTALYLYADGSRNINFDNHATSLISVRATGGITFNGDTAAANALGDYEEGTFTPELYFDNTEIGTKVTNYPLARYVKIGMVVHVNGVIGYNSINTSGGTYLRVRGLPFNVYEHGQPNNWTQPGIIRVNGNAPSEFAIACGNSGTNRAICIYNNSGVTDQYVTSSVVSGWNGNNRYFWFALTYYTEA